MVLVTRIPVDCQAAPLSLYAYASPDIGAALHRGHSYRVKFGSNPKYAVIEEVIEEVALPALSGVP